MRRFNTIIETIEQHAFSAGEHLAVADEHYSLSYSFCHLLPKHINAIPISQIMAITDSGIGELPLPSLHDLALIIYTSGSSGQPSASYTRAINLYQRLLH